MIRSVLAANLIRLMEERHLNPRRLALLAGLGVTAVRDIIEGKSQSPRAITIEKLAKALRTTTTALLESPTPQEGIPMVGRVRIGGYIRRATQAEALAVDALDLPHAGAGYEAVIVEGAVLEPIYQAGDVLFYRRPAGGDWRAALYRVCVVESARGRLSVHRVEPTSRPDVVSLISIVGAVAQTTTIRWAAPILWVKRAG